MIADGASSSPQTRGRVAVMQLRHDVCMAPQAAHPTSARVRRLPSWLVPLAIGALGLLALVVLLDPGGDTRTLRLDDLPRGVSARVISGEPVFVVVDGQDVDVFVPDPRHLAGDTLWWCPHEEVFVGPEHGEAFTRDGLAIGGPARG